MRDIESELKLKKAKIFVENFFGTIGNQSPEIAYCNYLMDILLYSPTNKAIRENWTFLCYSFSKITQTPIHELMEIEMELHNKIFFERVDERTLPHYQDELDNVIYRYTARHAVMDGVFVGVGRFAFFPVFFTSNLYNEGYEDDVKRNKLIERGIEVLSRDDPEDTDYLRLRVIEKNRVWVAYTGEGYTFMKPRDY